jgi:hypothetical protein
VGQSYLLQSFLKKIIELVNLAHLEVFEVVYLK